MTDDGERRHRLLGSASRHSTAVYCTRWRPLTCQRNTRSDCCF